MARVVSGLRMRGPMVAALLLLLTGLPFFVQGAQAEAADPMCGAPLGVSAERRADAVLENGTDPEYDLIDTVRMPGAQRSPETIVNFGGRLALVAEVKVDEGSNFTWGVFVRFHSNTTGWNTTKIWLSSNDTTSYYPVGVHIRPSAALWRDRLYVAWDAGNSEWGGTNSRLIVLRSVDANGTVDAVRVASDTDPAKANQHPYLLPVGDKLVLAYATASGETDPSVNHIVVRSFDGSTFGPSVNLSNTSDEWSDALPVVAADPSGKLFALWSSVNTLGTAARLMFSFLEAANWSTPESIADLGHSPASSPGAAFYKGTLFVAYSLDYLPDINGTDYEVFWRRFDPPSQTWSAAESANPQPSNGDDLDPTLKVIGDSLFVGWSTDEDAYYANGSHPDPVYRVFDGSVLGPILQLSDPTDRAIDGAPHFVPIGDHLYAHWMWQLPPAPGTPRGDAREALRLVSRPPQWYDGLDAYYQIAEVSDNGSTKLIISIYEGDRPSGVSFVLRLQDGSLFPGEPSPYPWYSFWAPVEPDRPDFEVLACGKPIPAIRIHGDPAADPAPLMLLIVVAAVATIAIVAVAVLLRTRGSHR